MTIAEFKAYFTEFVLTSDAQIQRAYDIAYNTCSAVVLGDKYDLGIKYLTAHFVTLNSGQFSGSSSGNKKVASKSVDGVSISYVDNGANMEAINGNLDMTSYGQMYQRLIFGIGAGGFTAC